MLVFLYASPYIPSLLLVGGKGEMFGNTNSNNFPSGSN